MSQYRLELYVTGKTAASRRAISNLKRICEDDLSGAYSLTVIDILERPEKAEAIKILATPTLIRLHPSPPCRIVGDMSDRQKVLAYLDVPHDFPSPSYRNPASWCFPSQAWN